MRRALLVPCFAGAWLVGCSLNFDQFEPRPETSVPVGGAGGADASGGNAGDNSGGMAGSSGAAGSGGSSDSGIGGAAGSSGAGTGGADSGVGGKGGTDAGSGGTSGTGGAGGNDGGVLPDAGADGAVEAGDSGTDAPVDSGTDAPVDSGTDAAVDSGTDAAVDSGTDAAVDSGTDAAIDSGTDAAADCSPVTNEYQASFYGNKTLSGLAIWATNEPAINHDWGTIGPGHGVPAVNFSARWSGCFQFAAGTYTFTSVSDDGIRVWVDSDPIIQNWTNHSATTDQAVRTLQLGPHLVVVEYYQGVGAGVTRFSWK